MAVVASAPDGAITGHTQIAPECTERAPFALLHAMGSFGQPERRCPELMLSTPRLHPASAPHVEELPGHPATLLRGQEYDHIGHVLGLAKPGQWN